MDHIFQESLKDLKQKVEDTCRYIDETRVALHNIENTQQLILQQLSAVQKSQEEQHKIIWGEPEKLGEGGLVVTMNSVKKDLKIDLQRKAQMYAITGTVIATIITGLLNFLLTKIYALPRIIK